MEPRGPVAAVILAAGAATRFGAPKQNILLPAVLENVARADVDDVVIVAGAHELQVDVPPHARIVSCPNWADGPGASLHCGLSALEAATGAAVVILADGPRIDPRAIDRIRKAWSRGEGAVLAASYRGVRDHPVLLARDAWMTVPLEGGRALDARLVDCSDLRWPGDVDTEEDLTRLSGNSHA